MAPKAFLDLHSLPEDTRIKMIGEQAMTGARVLFFVDDDECADRYLRKIRSTFPHVVCVSRVHGPKDTIGVTVTKRPN